MTQSARVEHTETTSGSNDNDRVTLHSPLNFHPSQQDPSAYYKPVRAGTTSIFSRLLARQYVRGRRKLFQFLIRYRYFAVRPGRYKQLLVFRVIVAKWDLYNHVSNLTRKNIAVAGDLQSRRPPAALLSKPGSALNAPKTTHTSRRCNDRHSPPPRNRGWNCS